MQPVTVSHVVRLSKTICIVLILCDATSLLTLLPGNYGATACALLRATQLLSAFGSRFISEVGMFE